MERLNDRLQSQSWEELCDNGNGILNILDFLINEEEYFAYWNFTLVELDDEDAVYTKVETRQLSAAPRE